MTTQDIIAIVKLLALVGVAILIYIIYRRGKQYERKVQQIREEKAQKARMQEEVERSQWSTNKTDYTKLDERLSNKKYWYSDRDLDYSYLRNVLANENYIVANSETVYLMLRAMRKKSSYDRLFVSDFNNFPCKDLITIDRLWTHYSNSRFGFTRQYDIWLAVKEDLPSFKSHVGWTSVSGMYLDRNREEIQLWIKDSAPPGHLPNLFWGEGYVSPAEYGSHHLRLTLRTDIVSETIKVRVTLDDWGSGGNAPITTTEDKDLYYSKGGFSLIMDRFKSCKDIIE